MATAGAGWELGCELRLEKLEELTGNAGAVQEFRALLDRHALVRIELGNLPSPEVLLRLAECLGEPHSPSVYGVKTLPGYERIGDFAAPAKVDDGRPARANPLELLHYDVMKSGWAGYGILLNRRVPRTLPMQWVDMRALGDALAEPLRSALRGRSAWQLPRPTLEVPRPSAFRHPLLALHPRTGVRVLLLPDRRRGRVDELSGEESRALLAELWRAVDASRARCVRELRSRELYVWDNLATTHTNPSYPRDQERDVWFINVPCEREPHAFASF